MSFLMCTRMPSTLSRIGLMFTSKKKQLKIVLSEIQWQLAFFRYLTDDSKKVTIVYAKVIPSKCRATILTKVNLVDKKY